MRMGSDFVFVLASYMRSSAQKVAVV